MVSTKQKTATAALTTLLLLSAGGAAFLHKNPNPTLREVFAACEAGEVSGVACCENILDKECAPISPGNPDPLGVRKKMEADFDASMEKP